MRRFTCEACGSAVGFEMSMCAVCASPLGYLPDERAVRTLRPTGPASFRISGDTGTDWWHCLNAAWGCNWLLPAGSGETWCRSCALTRGRPDDARPAAISAWSVAEASKRRLVHQLDRLGLPVEARGPANPEGLVFELVYIPGQRGLTGHLDNVVTLDLAEADAAHCDELRRRLGEPFRTLLGNLRHEIAHHYWSSLVVDAGELESFRRLFGDDRTDYATAVEHYYATSTSWDEHRFISRYAHAHPHEDWAETFAHYLHLVDLVDTAADHGLIDLALDDDRLPCPAGASLRDLVALWAPVASAFDGLADTIGADHLYPVVPMGFVLDKLAYVHARITEPTSTGGMSMADKSPRQHQSKKSGKSLKEKRADKKTKQATRQASK